MPAARAVRSTVALVAALAAGTVALAACGTQTQTGGTVDGLAVLHIGARADGLPAADSAAGRDAGATLDGTLPTGPDHGPVVRFASGPDEGEVRALASALGLTGDVEKRAHGWLVESDGGALRVRADASGQWTFSRSGDDCPAYSIDVDAATSDSAVSCARAKAAAPGAAAGSPAVAVPVPADDVALELAGPVLDAAGVEGDRRVLAYGGPVRTVVVDPEVSGLATSGLRTSVDVDRDGVVGATGWLGTAGDGDGDGDGADYPIISAQAAFDRFASAPRPELGMPCVDTGATARDGAAVGAPAASASDLPLPIPCAIEPAVVTGAALGLMLQRDGDDPVLVPAWLLVVRGSDDPIAVVAVEDRFLADPEPTSKPTAEPPSAGGGTSGSDPGTAPEPGTSETPAPPPSDPGADPSSGSGSGQTVAITRAYLDADGTTLALVGWGGVCAEYSGIVDEAPDAVKAQIVGRSTLGADQACIEIAQEIKVLVQLRADLGTRPLVDATTGRTIPVTRT